MDNCLTYALPLWHKHGGYLIVRKSEKLAIAHVMWLGKDGLKHYSPEVAEEKQLRHLLAGFTGFDGVVKTKDIVIPNPMSLFGLLTSAWIFALAATWFCIKEVFRNLTRGNMMKQALIALDQFINTFVWAKDEGFGMADETLSARMWRLGVLEGRSETWYRAMWLVDSIFFWDKKKDEAGREIRHCELSYMSELQRSQYPKGYSNISQC
jgi:hypothetical protein